uniref:Transmembrane protein 65 n=1 Tax=Callorhinchus milii TaxID=7868 RepID=A0A4W3J5N5_CALMI
THRWNLSGAMILIVKFCVDLSSSIINFPSFSHLAVFLHSAIPFVGFGFLDNAIMIVAGTQIELSIGVIFGISTMAGMIATGLRTSFAISLAGYVEALAYRLGLPCPDLSPKQADMWQTRVSSQLGKVIGVTIGCCLGMFPLLFLKSDEEEIPEETAKLIEENTIDQK